MKINIYENNKNIMKYNIIKINIIIMKGYFYINFKELKLKYL